MKETFIPAPSTIRDLAGLSTADLEAALLPYTPARTPVQRKWIANFEVTPTADLVKLVDSAHRGTRDLRNGLYLQRRTVKGAKAIVLSSFATGEVLAIRSIHE